MHKMEIKCSKFLKESFRNFIDSYNEHKLSSNCYWLSIKNNSINFTKNNAFKIFSIEDNSKKK